VVKAFRSPTAWLALGAFALIGAACSNSSTAGTTTTTSSPTSNSTTSSTTAGSSTTSSTVAGASIGQISSDLSSGTVSTFLAKYGFTSTEAGKTESGTLTLAHSGSDFLFGIKFSTGSFEEIETSSSTVVCSATAATWMCYGGALEKDFAGSIDAFQNLFDPAKQSAALKAEEAGAYDVTSSSTTVAGQSASCVTYHSHTNNGVYTVCVTSGGELASLNGSNTSGSWKASLTSLSTSVPSSTFTPPASVTTS
jgi:hypothetical protein